MPAFKHDGCSSMKRLIILVLSTICATSALANDFPTQARVEFVIGCMEAHGGQSYDTLYPCICSIDKVATQVSFEEYAAVETLTYLWSTPGERGGVFRDASPNSRKRIKHLAKVVGDAQDSCFITAKTE
jgi:hypothetical protein